MHETAIDLRSSDWCSDVFSSDLNRRLHICWKMPWRRARLCASTIDLLFDDGRRRSFSVANRPNGETLELHIRVTPEGRFANWAANEMPERAILRLEGPLGAFYLREDSQRPIVMVAGGTGIAPIHALHAALLTERKSGV